MGGGRGRRSRRDRRRVLSREPGVGGGPADRLVIGWAANEEVSLFACEAFDGGVAVWRARDAKPVADQLGSARREQQVSTRHGHECAEVVLVKIPDEEKSGKTFRVGIFLDFVWLTTRTMHPHGAYVRGARRNRIGPHGGGVERLTTRTVWRGPWPRQSRIQLG